MAGPADSSGGPVRPLVALGLATVTFIALLIFGLGMVSLILNADIVEAPGLGQLPGVFATTLTTGVFALVLWFVVRLPQPRYRGALSVAVACYLDRSPAPVPKEHASSGERDRGAGRPTKRDRRLIQRLKGR